LLRLPELSADESRTLLALFDELDLAENLPITTLIGLAADAGTAWADLRVGEMKTLLALAAGDTDAAIDGCIWIGQFGQLGEERARVYRCIQNMLQLEDVAHYDANLRLMFGDATLSQAYALVNREQQFFGLNTLGPNMEGSTMHTRLLGAYDKVQRPQMA
jgi:ribosomal protein S12 methylthiotransferase accessory factor